MGPSRRACSASCATGCITAIIGASCAGDAFSLANTLPNVLYVLAAGGILNAVLIPSLARAMKLEDGGQEFTDRVITVALAGMLVITVVVMAGAGGFVWLLARNRRPSSRTLAIAFSLICLPQLFFYGLFALLGPDPQRAGAVRRVRVGALHRQRRRRRRARCSSSSSSRQPHLVGPTRQRSPATRPSGPDR